MEKLDADNNKLSSLDVSRNTALKTLYLYTNELTSIDVSKNLELDILHLDYNNVCSASHKK